jgi:hypothetical protein
VLKSIGGKPVASSREVGFIVGGSVDLMFDNLGVSLALVKSGQLKLLGVATAKLVASLPDVPTIAQTLPGFQSAAWYAIVAPPKTPQAVVDKLNGNVNEPQCQDDIVQRLTQLSAEAIGGTPPSDGRLYARRGRALAQGHQGRERQARMIRPDPTKGGNAVREPKSDCRILILSRWSACRDPTRPTATATARSRIRLADASRQTRS